MKNESLIFRSKGDATSGEIDLCHPAPVVADGPYRLLQDVEHRVVEEPAADRSQDDGGGCDDDAVAQLDEVPDDGHLLLRVLLLCSRGFPLTVLFHFS